MVSMVNGDVNILEHSDAMDISQPLSFIGKLVSFGGIVELDQKWCT